jgi:enamine deaminase RidA (YjgF/YER057c/UK114 family)
MAKTLRKSSSRGSRSARGSVQYLNPESLPRNPAFTQVVVASGPVRTVYLGAQTAVDASGTLVGKGDVAAQTEQILKNIETCLQALVPSQSTLSNGISTLSKASLFNLPLRQACAGGVADLIHRRTPSCSF